MKILLKTLDVASQWHFEKNSHIDFEKITHASAKKVWWKCDKSEDHEWQAVIFHRTIKGHSCPFCDNSKTCISNSLKTLFPDVAKQWHSKNQKTANDFVPGSCKKVWWLCSAGHEWEAEIRARTKRNHGCPYCSNKKILVANSFATKHPELAKEWHVDNKLTAKELSPGSAFEGNWVCSKCQYTWKTRVTSRCLEHKGCPQCANASKSIKMKELILSGWDNYKNNYETGYYTSDKNQKDIFYRSSYEKKAYSILENDINVVAYEAEPIEIAYKINNQMRQYIPDILVHYIDNTHRFIEVKSWYAIWSEEQRPKILAKLKALIQYSFIVDYKTPRLWHEKHLRIKK